ncbi:hypothetical protein [Pseudomonas syringae pv. coryli]|uniref:hypothetical protein n=2 Tax=Pseudomonas syringae pv. coryli TaxID=317659 RepID=UPI000619B2A0|nr:hypothetical protein [Pseudomonas syringae pv. coryli]
MTITMNLEIEQGISFDDICRTLSSMNTDYQIEEKHLTGNFISSNAYFVFRHIVPYEEIVAENVIADWKVGMRGAFHSPIDTLSESSEDIKTFLSELVKQTQFKFILSFQFEEVYALRDNSGIRFLKNMID